MISILTISYARTTREVQVVVVLVISFIIVSLQA